MDQDSQKVQFEQDCELGPSVRTRWRPPSSTPISRKIDPNFCSSRQIFDNLRAPIRLQRRKSQGDWFVISARPATAKSPMP